MQLKSIIEGKSFLFTVESKEVEVLREASEKYGVQIPNAQYLITYFDGMFDIYHSLEGYGVVEWAFGWPESNLNQMKDLPTDYKDEENAKDNAIAILRWSLGDMYWGDILAQYLAEEGIDYEESNGHGEE